MRRRSCENVKLHRNRAGVYSSKGPVVECQTNDPPRSLILKLLGSRIQRTNMREQGKHVLNRRWCKPSCACPSARSALVIKEQADTLWHVVHRHRAASYFPIHGDSLVIPRLVVRQR